MELAVICAHLWDMAAFARYAHYRPEMQAALHRGELQILQRLRGSAKHYPARQRLSEGSAEQAYVYRLLTGWACRTRTLRDGRDQCILIFLPGDLFAIKSMFAERHPDAVQTLSAATIERVHHLDLHKLCRDDPDVCLRCLSQSVEEERLLNNWIVALGQGSAEERVAMLLLDFYRRLQMSESIPEGASSYAMPLTQAQLADHLGITPIHVNRILKMLRERQIVRIKDGTVHIPDMPALIRIAYPLLDVAESPTPDRSALTHVIACEVTSARNAGA
jgi:CRP/FNR family transcriptional regulator